MELNHPIVEILSYYMQQPAKPAKRSVLVDYLYSLDFHLIPSNVIMQVTENIYQNMDIIDALKPIIPHVSFNATVLAQFLVYNDNNELYNKYSAPIVFSNALAFLLQEVGQSFIADFSILLNSLFSLTNGETTKVSNYLYLLVVNHSIQVSPVSFSIELILMMCNQMCFHSQATKFALDTVILLINRSRPNLDQCSAIFILVQKITISLVENHVQFDDTELFEAIKPELSQLRPEALQLIPTLATRNNGSKNLENVFIKIAEAAISLYDPAQVTSKLQFACSDENPFTDFHPVEHFKLYKSEYSLIQQYEFPPISQELTIHQFISNSSRLEYKNYRFMFKDIDHHYRTIFYKELVKQMNMKEFDANRFALFFYVLNRVQHVSEIDDEMIQLLFSEKIFEPNTAIFFNPENFAETTFFRQKIIYVVLFFAPSAFPKILKMHEEKPFMCAEIMARILNITQKEQLPSSLHTPEVLITVLRVENALAKFCQTENNDLFEMALNARATVFKFFFLLFNFPLYSNVTNSDLYSAFKEAISDKNFTDSILAMISIFPKGVFFQNTLKTYVFGDPDEDFILSIFKIKSKFWIKDPRLGSNVVHTIFSFLDHKKIISLLSSTMNMIVHLYDIYNDQNMINIWNVGRILQQTEYGIEQVDKLFRSMNALNSGEDVFIIKNAELFPMMYAVYSTFNKGEEFLKVVMNFCEYSNYNRLMLHDAEFDILLLEIIHNFPEDFIFREIKIKNFDNYDIISEAVFPLFWKIASTKSSSIIAEKMLKLLVPIDEDHTFKETSYKIIKQLTKMPKQISKFHTISTPITIKNIWQSYSKIDTTQFIKGTTLTFWIYIDPIMNQLIDTNSIIMRAIVHKCSFVEISMQKTSIICSVNQESSISAFSLADEIPTGKWNFIVIQHQTSPNGKMLEMLFRVNMEEVKVFPIIMHKADKPGKLKISIGNTNESNSPNKQYLNCLASIEKFNFFMFFLDEADLTSMFNNKTILKRPLFTYPVKESPPEIPQIQSIFRFVYPADNFVPFFAYFDYSPLEFNYNIISLFSTLYGSAACLHFPTISFILSKLQKPLNSQHYLKFYEYFSICKSDITIISLVENILFNFDIWIRCAADDFYAIIDHWCSDLFTKGQIFFMKDTFFKSVITDVRKYLYYSNDEEFHAERDPSLDIGKCVNGLMQLLVERAKIYISKEDVNDVITAIIVCKDMKLVEIFSKLATTLLSIVKPTSVHAQLLHRIPLADNPNLFTQMIQSLYLATDSSFHLNTLILAYHLPIGFMYHNFIDDFQHFYELYSLSIILSLQQDEDYFKEQVACTLLAFANIQNTRDMIIKNQLWMLWPIIFALQVKGKARNAIVSFIIQLIYTENARKAYHRCFDILGLLQVKTNLDVMNLQSELLLAMFDMMKEGNYFDQQRVSFMTKYCFKILLISTSISTVSNELVSSFCDSPFSSSAIEESSESTNKKIDQITQMSHLKNALKFKKADIIIRIQINNVPEDFRERTYNFMKNVKTPNMMTKMIRKVSQYHVSSPEKKYQILEKLTNFWPNIITSVIKKTKHHAMTTKNLLKNLFTQIDEQIYLIDHVNVNDFINRDLDQYEQAKINFPNLIRDYFSINTLWKDKSFQTTTWKRDFKFNSSFNTITMKKRINRPTRKICKLLQAPTSTVEFKCVIVRIDKIINSHLYIFTNKIVIFREKRKQMSYKLSEIINVITKTRLQKKTAIEFHFRNGKSILLDFAPSSANSVLHHLSKSKLKNVGIYENENYVDCLNRYQLVKNWTNRTISNFEFILKLNIMTGRSFYDPENYIIFPWVLLNCAGKIRNLSYPITVQEKSKLINYRKILEVNPYLFGTAPSNPMLLSYLLVRMDPYLKLHKKVHDNHFDLVDRMFTNYDKALQVIVNGDEVREATPEIYSFPEIFMKLYDCIEIGDLEVSTTLFDFIYQSRVALESEEVSQSLCEWIDLIWGVRQRGDGAESKYNIFMEDLYQGVWKKSENSKEVTESLLRTLGSMPPQVFTEKVPKRIEIPCPIIENVICIPLNMESIKRAYLTSAGGRIICFFNNGSVKRYTFDIESKEIINAYVSSLKLGFSKNCKVSVSFNTVYVFDNDNQQIHLITYETLRTVNAKFSHVARVLSYNHSQVITIHSDGVINLWNSPQFTHPISSISVSIDSIACVASSCEYGVVAIGTKDFNIRIYSLENKKYVNSYSLEGFLPRKIIITESFGFILVYVSSEIHILTINGFFVKKVQINFEIDIWSTWKSAGGFDFVCCGDPYGRIFTFEAFFPDKVKQLPGCGERITSLRYNTQIGAINAVTTIIDPCVYIIPC